VGLLRRQLERQWGGMSVRTLLDTFGELITQILPITLMSPESMARFFPAKSGLFDVVVFDEASQIRVADAAGAMGRAGSVVVVGDSKQMPPTSFGETALDADDEVELSAEVVQDEESILSECVHSQVPSKWLSWHYRSQDESLISFSNHHYYESRLSSFPAPPRAAERESLDGYGVSLVRVNGTCNRAGKGKELRTNRIEAEAIVAEIRRRFDGASAAQTDAPLADFEAPSLGVVTFNAQQRDFIENLLRDTGDERILNALDHDSEGLFVKNLENVQGDERDAILFSIAFSVNEKGFLPLNFGRLQRAGGERRLNVAVTRARRQVLLFASFDPSELRAEQTSSIGVKHLKPYLEMAASVSDALEADPRSTAIFDRHRDDIAAELRMRGLAVKTDVGLSDFRVDLSIAPADAPDRPVLAVLLDGDSWKSRRTVADRDGLPSRS
jgi:superfamily I DNA and/or RNA helicase